MDTDDQIPALIETSPEPARNAWLSRKEDLLGLARPFVFGGMAMCLLLSVAFYNGYPTVFSDTGSYLLTGAFLVAFEPYRAPIYSIFIRTTSIGGSGWDTVLAQAFLVVYVLYEACDYLIPENQKFRDACLLANVFVLTALTSLPWLVSLLMPDVFAGVVFLAAFLLAFADDLPLARRMFLAVILSISIGSHTSLFAIAAAFIAALFILKFAGHRKNDGFRAKSALAWLLVPMIVAGLWTANLNRQMDLGFRLAPSKDTFLLAKLFGDGLAADYLRENCPQQPQIACRYLSNLPRRAEEFLFWHPLLKDYKGHEDEMDALARDTILAYPLKFALNSIRGTLLQLASLKTGDEIRDYGTAQWNNSAIQQVFPGDFKALSNDRQFRSRLMPLVDTVAIIHTVIFWLSFVACLMIARTGRFERINVFFYSALIFLFINAAVCATFAGVYDRYQSRVAWLIPFSLTAYGWCLVWEWKRGVVPGEDPACSTDSSNEAQECG